MDLFPNFSFAKFSPTLFKYVKNLAKEKLGKISHFLICSRLRKMSIFFPPARAGGKEGESLGSWSCFAFFG